MRTVGRGACAVPFRFEVSIAHSAAHRLYPALPLALDGSHAFVEHDGSDRRGRKSGEPIFHAGRDKIEGTRNRPATKRELVRSSLRELHLESPVGAAGRRKRRALQSALRLHRQ